MMWDNSSGSRDNILLLKVPADVSAEVRPWKAGGFDGAAGGGAEHYANAVGSLAYANDAAIAAADEPHAPGRAPPAAFKMSRAQVVHLAKAGLDQLCLPRRPSRFKPSSIELDDIL